MNPMNELMTILRKKNPEANQKRLAEITGTHETTINKCLSGARQSTKLANWIAARYGGKCLQLRAEVFRLNRTKMDAELNRYHQQKHYETHNLTPIDTDDIRCPLPVIHPQPVYLGKPLWAI